MLRFQRKKVAVAATTTRMFVVFTVSGKDFGLDIMNVREAIRLGSVVSVPKTPPWISGIMDLRGEVIPVVDLARRLDLDLPEEEGGKGILVTVGGQVIALKVDDVHEVIDLEEGNITSPREVIGGIEEGFMEGVGQTSRGLLLILTPEKLFSVNERVALSTVRRKERAASA